MVASLLQRPELRPILSALGWSDSQRRRGSDDAVVTSIRDFLATHLHSDGTRFNEQQAAFNVLVQAAAGPLVKSERHIAAAAEALGVRYATFRAGLRTHASRDRLRRMTYAARSGYTARVYVCVCVSLSLICLFV